MIEQIQLKNFRKFSSFDLDCNQRIVIFTGPNASGKTTILEAIYLVSTSKSHRTNDINSLIKTNEETGSVLIKAQKNYQMMFSKEGKRYTINQVPYPKVSEFIGRVPVLMFSPSDIELVVGTKGVRRHFLDLEISLLDKSYLRGVTAYKRLLKERNELLKSYQPQQNLILNVITKQLIEEMVKLYHIRIQFIDHINMKLLEVCRDLESEQVQLVYLPSYDIDHLKECFERKLSYDLLTKTTNIGLHRDDFLIQINGMEAKDYASEGQTRNIALAIKLAIKKIYEEKNKSVVLLLDDVFASLDQKRINHIMNYINKENQTMITTTSLFNIPDELLKDAKIVKL